MRKRNILLIFIIPLVVVSCHKKEYVHPFVKAKNIIYIIGDGMGPAALKAGELYSKSTFPFTSWNNYVVYTNSMDIFGLTTVTTDSAAAATALASGSATLNGRIGKDYHSNDVKTVLDVALSKNKKIGVVTTDNIYGATPAGFSAHSSSRNNTEQILTSQAKTSNLNLLVGTFSSTCQEYKTTFEDNNYKYLESLDRSYFQEDKIIINNKKLKPYGDTNTLLDSTKYAIDYLNQGEFGYTLMIEQAHIDKYSHKNDFDNMVKSVVQLNKTVSYLIDRYKNDDETLIVVTADHETGGLSVWEEEGVLKYSYSTKNHTKIHVPLYTNKLIFSTEIAFGSTIKNTDLALRIKDIINSQNN